MIKGTFISDNIKYLVMNCCYFKIDITKFVSSGYNLNTFNDHENKLIFIIVETEVKKMLHKCKNRAKQFFLNNSN